MKQRVFAITAFLVLSVSTCFASPLNNLATGQTALGIGTHNLYVEHKINDTITLGFQNEDLNNASDMNDVYGQVKLSENLRAIVGNRSFDSTSKLYVGLGIDAPLASELGGYASLIGGDQFEEVQVGANFQLSKTADLNVGYYSYMPEYGSDKNGVNAGVTFKF
jgi:hypothetical protein